MWSHLYNNPPNYTGSQEHIKMLKLVALCLALTALTLANEEIDALNYLRQYHYISPSRSGNHNVKSAIENFQRFAGIPVTGKLDGPTLRQMKKPRCGIPDADEDGRIRRYATSGSWRKKSLTYYVQHGKDLSVSQQNRIFKKALQYWADVSSLSFRAVRSPRGADIKISFGVRAHGGTSAEGSCGSRFDGRGGVLAHAYFPSDGRAHFDEEETYTDGKQSGTNLEWVATHEFGHSLGLKHSSVRGAIMYPYYTGYKPNMRLHQDDIAGIRSLYGSGDGGGGGGGGGGGTCNDKNTRCPGWTRYCSYYPYVKENCRKTCNLC